MIKKFLFIFLFLSVLLVGYLFTEPLYTPTALISSPSRIYLPKYIAHQSIISGKYTGNTQEAIQEALQSPIEAIELDVRMSMDGVLFIYHGNTLEEGTNGTGPPEDKPWSQLQNLTYKSSTSKLVSLEAALQLVSQRKMVFLDIKTTRLRNKEFVEKLVNIIQKNHLEESVIVESFNPFFLCEMRLRCRDILLMYDFTTNTKAGEQEKQDQFDQIPWILKQPFFQKQIRRLVRPDFLGIRFNTGDDIITNLANFGYPIIAWTVDDEATIQKLRKLGVRSFQTNTPLAFEKENGPHTIYDAGFSKSQQDVIFIQKEEDILAALDTAKKNHKKITIAGRRHSMGGQTLLDKAIQLDMLGLNHVNYSPEKQTVLVGSGATWKKVQNVLNSYGRSVKIMQSDNIFTVGGSVSVNVHGWQISSPPIGSSVIQIKIITWDGQKKIINKTTEPDLFNAVIGGYGLFGVITEVELETVPNTPLGFHCAFMPTQKFADFFEAEISKNPKAQLAYGRLSVDKENMFKEVGVFWYEQMEDTTITTPIEPEDFVGLKRTFFRLSEYFDVGKKARWVAEKLFSQYKASQKPVSRNNAMNTDIHVLWQLYGDNRDILHEYFIPKSKVREFLEEFKRLVDQFDMNLLNVTIRDVLQDNQSKLPYAQNDMFSFVCLFSQEAGREAEKDMKIFTQKLIDKVISLKGTFYLPYRLHYRKEQLEQAYPQLKSWLKLKDMVDPQNIFTSQFYEYIADG